MAAFPFFPQYDPDDCGVMALRMVCHYHGRPVSAFRIREACGVPYGDLSLLALSHGASRMGLKTISLDIPLSELNEQVGLPLIVHVQNRHFVVLYAMSGEDLLIADPARGRLRISRERFASEWLHRGTMHALLTEVGQPPPAGSADPGIATSLDQERLATGWTLQTWSRLVLEGGTLWLLLQWAGTLFASVHPQDGTLWIPLAITLLLSLSWWILLVQWRKQRQQFLQRHFAGLDLKESAAWSGADLSLSLRMVRDIPWHRKRADNRFQGPRYLFLALLLLGFLGWHGPGGAWVAISAAMILGVVHFRSRDRRRTGIVLAAEQEREYFRAILSGQVLAESERMTFSALPPGSSLGFMPGLTILALTAFTLLAWMEGLSPDGVLLLFPVLVYFIFSFSRALIAIMALDLAGYRAIPYRSSIRQEDAFPGGSGGLRYQGPADSGLNVEIPAGTSMLLHLPENGHGTPWLNRFAAIEVDEGGQLWYHGTPVNKVNRKAFHQRVVAVWSKENLSGLPLEPELSASELSEIAEIQASLLPGEAYSSGEVAHSGSQVPILLARAMFADPEILLLDEGFSRMDPFRELIVLENLLTLRKGKTTIIASCREELVPSVDQVFQVDGSAGLAFLQKPV